MAKQKTSLSLSTEARAILRAVALKFGSERGMSMAAEVCIRAYAEDNGIKPVPEKPKRATKSTT